MNEDQRDELRRLNTAIAAAEDHLDRHFQKVLRMAESGEHTISAEGHQMKAEGDLSRLRARRDQLMQEANATDETPVGAQDGRAGA